MKKIAVVILAVTAIVWFPIIVVGEIIVRGFTPWKRYRIIGEAAEIHLVKDDSFVYIKRGSHDLAHIRYAGEEPNWARVWRTLAKNEESVNWEDLSYKFWSKYFTRDIYEGVKYFRFLALVWLVWIWGYPLFLVCVGIRKVYDMI